MDRFRLGLVGTGLITASSHLPAALGLPDVEVAAFVDSVPERAMALTRQYGLSARVAPRVQDILDTVDGVIIATPNSSHCNIALSCIEAGVHALIEKPLASTVREGTAIADAASRAGIVVATGFCTRFQPEVILLKELLDGGYFGQVTRFAHQFGSAGGWPSLSAYNLSRHEAGGGVLVVTGSHFLDRMLYFWGEPVSANLTDDSFGGPEANCTATFHYQAFQGIARYSKTARLPAGLVVETDRGIVALRDAYAAPIRFFPRSHPGFCETVSRAGEQAQEADVFQLQIMDFIDACRSRRPPRVDARQGVASLRLTEMLYANRSAIREEWY